MQLKVDGKPMRKIFKILVEYRLFPRQRYIRQKSFYLDQKRHVGETCGGVFWINLNSRLLQLYPTEEKYAGEIEKVIYNVILACQDHRGYIRYTNFLQGTKDKADCSGTCCEWFFSGTNCQTARIYILH